MFLLKKIFNAIRISLGKGESIREATPKCCADQMKEYVQEELGK